MSATVSTHRHPLKELPAKPVEYATCTTKAGEIAKKTFSGAENRDTVANFVSTRSVKVLETGRFKTNGKTPQVFIPRTGEVIKFGQPLGSGGFKTVCHGTMITKGGASTRVAISKPFKLKTSDVDTFIAHLGRQNESFLANARIIKVGPEKAVTISPLCTPEETHYEGESLAGALLLKKPASATTPSLGRPDYNYLRIVFSLFKGVHRYYTLMHQQGLFKGHHGDIKPENFFLGSKQKSDTIYCKPRLGDLPESPEGSNPYTYGYFRNDLNNHANDLNALRVMLVEALASAYYYPMFETDTKPLIKHFGRQQGLAISTFTGQLVDTAKSQAESRSTSSRDLSDSSYSNGSTSSGSIKKSSNSQSSQERGRELEENIIDLTHAIEKHLSNIKASHPLHWNVVSTLTSAIKTLGVGIQIATLAPDTRTSQKTVMSTLEEIGILFRSRLPSPAANHTGFGPADYSGSPAVPSAKIPQAIKRKSGGGKASKKLKLEKTNA